jgi:hypothetical protein
VFGDDDKKRMLSHRDEGLTALRMTLDKVKAVGKGARLGQKDRNAGAGFICFYHGKVMMPAAKACVYQAKLACGIKDIAEGRKGGGGQGAWDQQAHPPSLRHDRTAGKRVFLAPVIIGPWLTCIGPWARLVYHVNIGQGIR